MAERLPISLPEVYKRVNMIEDPIKRAGAQAFAGIYAPTLKFPEYSDSSLNRTIMHRRALRAKSWAMREAKIELGIPEEEPYDYSQLDEIAHQAGLKGIDLLNVSNRARHTFYRDNRRFTDLADISSKSDGVLLGIRGLGEPSLRQIREELRIITSLSQEEIQTRVEVRLKEREHQFSPSKDMGKTIVGAAGKVFELFGGRVDDSVTLEDLYGWGEIQPSEWLATFNELKPGEKGAVNGALRIALESGFRSIGDIRKASDEDLAKLGINRAIFFRNAFGIPVKSN